jgi:3-hexulose-6-phosphate synthase
VADFKGYDVPYSAEGRFYFEAGTDLITVMGSAPDEAIREAVDGARKHGKAVAFDLMSYEDDQAKAHRAKPLADMGAELISCHTGWNEQAAGKTPDALLERVHQALSGTAAQMVAMGGLTPQNVSQLGQYADTGKLFAVVSGSAITRHPEPSSVVAAFLDELSRLEPALH